MVFRHAHAVGQRLASPIAWGFLLVMVAGCGVGPATHSPTAAGVVQRLESIGEITRFNLRDGRQIDVDPSRARPLYQGGVTPHVGDLMLVGQDSDRPWYVGISPESGGEYVLQARSISLEAQHVQLDSGLRLVLAPAFTAPSGPFEPDASRRIVLDPTGEVLSIN